MKQREIKFRAWDSKEKKMTTCLSPRVELLIGFDGVLVTDNMRIDGTQSGEEVILMQYTGLKDKNGKEVWEGNIIKRYCPCGECKTWWIGEVVYLDEMACFGFKEVGKKRYTQLIMYDEANAGKVAPIEVIGNVYENNEILRNNSHNKNQGAHKKD